MNLKKYKSGFHKVFEKNNFKNCHFFLIIHFNIRFFKDHILFEKF